MKEQRNIRARASRLCSKQVHPLCEEAGADEAVERIGGRYDKWGPSTSIKPYPNSSTAMQSASSNAEAARTIKTHLTHLNPKSCRRLLSSGLWRPPSTDRSKAPPMLSLQRRLRVATVVGYLQVNGGDWVVM